MNKIKNTSQNIITFISALTVVTALVGNIINSWYVNAKSKDDVLKLIPIVHANQVYISVNLDEELYLLGEKLAMKGKLNISDVTKLQNYKNGIYQQATAYQQAMIDGLIYPTKQLIRVKMFISTL